MHRQGLGPEVIANDAYVCDAASMQIISGSNMSGKSTYIRQIALQQILAQVSWYLTSEIAP